MPRFQFREIQFLFFAIFIGCSQQSEKKSIAEKSIEVDAGIDVTVQSQSEIKEEYGPCSIDMTHIKGEFCTKVEQKCIKWKEPPEKNPRARCLEFAPSTCISDRVHMDYCIDTNEFTTNFQGVPVTDISWTQAKEICLANSKDLCTEDEWTFACEGEEMYPYPTGYTRPSDVCNMDIEKFVVCGKHLCDKRYSVTDFPNCKSPFGVLNMSGNADEWIQVPKYQHSKIKGLWMRSSLKGGHWLPVRNRCRPRTDDHDESFKQISISFRCCSKINQ